MLGGGDIVLDSGIRFAATNIDGRLEPELAELGPLVRAIVQVAPAGRERRNKAATAHLLGNAALGSASGSHTAGVSIFVTSHLS